jgi:hypothetical protein
MPLTACLSLHHRPTQRPTHPPLPPPSPQGGITSGSQWLVWRFESDSTLGDACNGELGPFPVRQRGCCCRSGAPGAAAAAALAAARLQLEGR